MKNNMKDPTPEQKEKILEAFDRNEDFLKEFIRGYRKNPEAWDIMSNEERMKEFASSINLEDIEMCFGKGVIPENVAIAFSSGNDEEKFLALDYFSIGMISALYKHKHRKKYRTISTGSDDAQRKFPTSLAIPSSEPLRYSMSLYQEGHAYLQPLTSTDGLAFQNGRLYFAGNKMQQVSEVELQNMKTKEGIEDIDLAFLRIIYSLILKDYQDNDLKFSARTHKWNIRKLARYLGLRSNLSNSNIKSIIDKIQSYHNITGVLHGTRNGRAVKSFYQVLNFESYDDDHNEIEVSSPYMRYVIETAYAEAIKRKNGKIVLTKNGKPKRDASHSYLIHPDIAKEKNKRAVENVFILVSGIEQSGRKNGYHIAVSTLVERNPQLQEGLKRSSNKSQLLRTCFKKTYELLRTKTDLEKAYIDINLPDPDDPKVIPTIGTFDSLVIRIPHKGKKQEYKDDK